MRMRVGSWRNLLNAEDPTFDIRDGTLGRGQRGIEKVSEDAAEIGLSHTVGEGADYGHV